MKIKSFWMLAVAGLMLSVTCNIKDYEEPTSDSTLSLPGNVITPVATGGTYSIEVTSNGTWAASVSAGADWCTLDNASGTGNGSISVAVGENIALAPRNTTVTIAIKGSVIKQVAVKQASADTLLRVEPADLEPISTAGTYSAEVVSNCQWKASVNTEASAWCTITPASGDGRVPISVMVTPNPGAPRSATVSVSTASGTLTAQLVVRQNMDAFGVDPTSITALVEAKTYPVLVTTREQATTWTADLAPATATSWCSITPASGTGSGTVSVNVAENTSGASRAATLTVTSEGASKTVVVTQDAPTLTLSRNTLSVMSAAADYPVNVTSNVNWTASVSAGANWCTIAPASGTGNGTLTVNLTQNTTGAPRAATITVAGNGLSQTIAVKQLEEGSGVTINGITWAIKNVDAADAFAANPGARGKLYQWDNKTPHDYGNTSGWSSSNSTAAAWTAANDPCPDGWRVPTRDEFNNSLLSSPKRWVASSSDNWDIAGMWIGPNAATATAANPGLAIFLPVTGYATPPPLFGNFTFAGQDTDGRYWLSVPASSQNAYYFDCYSGAESAPSYAAGNLVKRSGHAVRCISE
jgi:uncharacterized protein (TIGR02145 family)